VTIKIIILVGFAAIFFVRCSNKDLNIENVNRSSDLIKCEKIFGSSLKDLEENNNILLQTGLLDTTTEHSPVQCADILIDKKEIILPLKSTKVVDDVTSEEFSDKFYKLTLISTKKQNKNGADFYTGKFTITNFRETKTFEIEGRISNL
jgi:hypothetical protein